MNLLMYMSTIAIAVLLPASLSMEGNVFAIVSERISESKGGILVLLAGNAVMAYFQNFTNFLVTKHTSALTLQVASVSFANLDRIFPCGDLSIFGFPYLSYEMENFWFYLGKKTCA